jgi:hypothetical protein
MRLRIDTLSQWRGLQYGIIFIKPYLSVLCTDTFPQWGRLQYGIVLLNLIRLDDIVKTTSPSGEGLYIE